MKFRCLSWRHQAAMKVLYWRQNSLQVHWNVNWREKWDLRTNWLARVDNWSFPFFLYETLKWETRVSWRLVVLCPHIYNLLLSEILVCHGDDYKEYVFLFISIIRIEEETEWFFRNFDKHLPNYTASHSKSLYCPFVKQAVFFSISDSLRWGCKIYNCDM